MSTQRVLAIFSAVMLVCAVALATLGSRPETLGRLIFLTDRTMLDGLRAVIEGWFGSWVWANLAMPVLLRPAWLIPACLALISVGAMLSLSTRKSTHRSHRRS